MSKFNLKAWRQRLYGNKVYEWGAPSDLDLTLEQYLKYENNKKEIPTYIELAAFAIELSEVLWERAAEQNPKLKELGQSYSYARSHFLDTLILEKKLLFSIQLDKSKPLLSIKGDKR